MHVTFMAEQAQSCANFWILLTGTTKTSDQICPNAHNCCAIRGAQRRMEARCCALRGAGKWFEMHVNVHLGALNSCKAADCRQTNSSTKGDRLISMRWHPLAHLDMVATVMTETLSNMPPRWAMDSQRTVVRIFGFACSPPGSSARKCVPVFSKPRASTVVSVTFFGCWQFVRLA